MWQLSVRDQNRQWTDLGTFGGISLAARRVLQLEGEPGGDRRKVGGQAATAISGCRSLAGRNFCPKPVPSVPL